MSIENTNLLHTNDFVLTINKFPTVSFFAQKVSLPQITMGSRELATPIMPVPIPSNRLTFDPLVITFKVDEELKNWLEVHQWLMVTGKLSEDCKDLEEMLRNSPGGLFSDATLTIMTNKQNPLLRFRFANAWPESLSGIEFSSTDGGTTYSDATLTLRYVSYNVEKA